MEHELPTYVLGTGEVDPRLAIASLTDFGFDFATVIITDECAWATTVAEKLSLEVVSDVPEFSQRDTVICVPDLGAVKPAFDAGAMCLDITDGLSQLELSEEAPGPAEGVAIPETAADSEPAPSPAPQEDGPKPKRTRRKAAPTPTETKQEETTMSHVEHLRELVRSLAAAEVDGADEDGLWALLDTLRGHA